MASSVTSISRQCPIVEPGRGALVLRRKPDRGCGTVDPSNLAFAKTPCTAPSESTDHHGRIDRVRGGSVGEGQRDHDIALLVAGSVGKRVARLLPWETPHATCPVYAMAD